MSMPFDHRTAGVLPKIPLNRRIRARLRRNDRARFDKIKEAAWRLMLDPMEQRVLLSADPLTVSLATTAGSADAVTVRFFEEQASGSGAVIQKVSITWGGASGIGGIGGQDIYEIGINNDGFLIETGLGDESVNIIIDTMTRPLTRPLNGDFSIEVDTEDGDDSITIISFAEGYIGGLNLTAEQITINSGVSVGTDATKVGNVELNATAGSNTTGTASASVVIDGSIYASGEVLVSADAVAGVQSSTDVIAVADFDIVATANVSVGEGSTITGNAISLVAATHVDVDIDVANAVAALSLVDVTTTTTVTIGAGATVSAGVGDLDGDATNGNQSILISATTDTDIDVSLTTLSASDFFADPVLSDILDNSGQPIFAPTPGDGFDLLISTLDVSRNTSVQIAGNAGTDPVDPSDDALSNINALGLVDISATSDGDIKNIVTSNFVGAATTTFDTDITEIVGSYLSSSALGFSMQATSLTQTQTTGKVAVNDVVDGRTHVGLANSSVQSVSVGALPINIGALDQARFYATSTSATLDPSLFTSVDLDYAAALNLLDRDTTVVLTETDLTSNNDVSVRANSAVWSVVLAEKMQASGTEVFDNTDVGAQAFVFGGTLAVNEMNGDVSVTTTNGVLTGDTVTVAAMNNAIFSSRAEAGQSMSGASGGAVGISVALNVLGFEVTSYLALVGIDALLGGVNLGTTATPYGAAVNMTGTSVAAGTAAHIKADNQLKANAFMSNAAESTADPAFGNSAGGAVAFALAMNKINTRARVDVSGASAAIVSGGYALAGSVDVAGTLDVTASDNAEISSETLIVAGSVTSSNFGLGLADELISQFSDATYRTNGVDIFEDDLQGLTLTALNSVPRDVGLWPKGHAAPEL